MYHYFCNNLKIKLMLKDQKEYNCQISKNIIDKMFIFKKL